MQYFILKYPEETVILDDFFEIKRTIDDKGDPDSIRYEISEENPHESRFYEVDLQTGCFSVDGCLIQPALDNGVLTHSDVDFRPVWFRRWYRTFQVAKGETGAQWALFLGWQFTEDGRNHKRMLQIHQDGTVGMG